MTRRHRQGAGGGAGRRPLIGLAAAAALLRWRGAAAEAPAERRIAVTDSALPPDPAHPHRHGPSGPFRAGDFGFVGVFDADWLLDPRYARLLDALAASPGAFAGVRFFGALNAGSREDDVPTASGGVWHRAEEPPDYSVPLDCLATLVSRGLVPFVALTFFPPAVSPSPIEPPADLAPWQRLVRGFLDAAAARFGAAELGRWWLEVWNEPNMPPFWHGDFDRYLDLYRATSEAVRASGHAVRLGGPAIACMPPTEGRALMERFLEFLRREPEVQCDFLSLHRKGIWVNEEAEPRVARLVEAAEATAEAALRLVPERCRAGLPIVNDEADMRVGFQHPYEPRLTERFPSWLAAVAIAHAALGARYGARGLRFLAASDDANQHLVREPFDGRRALTTRTALAPDDLVKLPVFGFYELLRLLGDRHGSVVAPEDAFFPRSGLHHAVTADEHRIAALFTLHPGAEDEAAERLRADRIAWALRDIPWPRVNLAMFRIDGTHANAFAAVGRRMPAPGLDAADAIRRVRAAAELGVAAPIRSGLAVEGGRLRLPPFRLEPYATALVWVTPFDPAARPAAPRWIAADADRHGNAVLRWTPNREPGFYTYELVRMTPGRGAAARIAPVPLRSAMWVDTAPPPGLAHVYGVRAVSASGARSALARSAPLRI